MRINDVRDSLVSVVPSSKEGVFVGQYGEDGPKFSKLAHIIGIDPNDITALTNGDKTVLSKYVTPDERRPGYFALNACRISIESGTNNLNQPVIDADSFGEFVPFEPQF